MKKIIVLTKRASELEGLRDYLKENLDNINIEILNELNTKSTADLLLFDCIKEDDLFISKIKTILIADKDIMNTKVLLKIKKLGYIDFILKPENEKYYPTIATKLRRYLYNLQFENSI